MIWRLIQFAVNSKNANVRANADRGSFMDMMKEDMQSA